MNLWEKTMMGVGIVVGAAVVVGCGWVVWTWWRVGRELDKDMEEGG